ncbi:uncharacterized protein TRUGW13939_05775 [Talaromyces rugulosus]|uniref:Calcineurin-like phosphoesterase domain-containing protein n=1 Tax=Talaromyces rugulosus TaxID=121627 RepID=A0A7H8QY93_TALRU|nr:uncharacterized protein TRUGW13939_05775 [Talaromyces rugulosus]QKX58648.1 hypothetical protein TRUGW13939_05775 [Talaromyces rugulosus]
MASTAQPLTRIKLRGHRRRRVADVLINAHRVNNSSAPLLRKSPNRSLIRVVCISDTHNKNPTVPLGDILIHAGDLTENGSFEEVQNGLRWLSSQPHKYKVFVAGNHDVLLDEAFLMKYPERRYGQSKTKQDLDWGDVIYLQDSAITLEIPVCTNDDVQDMRNLKIFGSPWTPQYGISAFQYPPNEPHHWDDIFASLDKTSPHIIVTHGPPHLHLDQRDFHRAGCPYLAEQTFRLRPRLHVFGHIHASYGREDIVLDSAQRAYEEVKTGWTGWEGVALMALMVVWARVKRFFMGPSKHSMTTFVNAAVVGGTHDELRNDAVVIDI